MGTDGVSASLKIVALAGVFSLDTGDCTVQSFLSVVLREVAAAERFRRDWNG